MQITWPMSSEFKKSKATIAGMAHFSYIFTISIQSHTLSTLHMVKLKAVKIMIE